MKSLNSRQERLILILGDMFSKAVAYLGYTCDSIEERSEVLEALEVFYSGLHEASMSLHEEEKQNGKTKRKKV